MRERPPVSAYHQSLDKFNRLVSSSWGMQRKVISERSVLERERISVLEKILTESKLAVCSRADKIHQGTPRQRLGIFPQSQMHLFYSRSASCGAYDREIVDEKFELLCPQHLPKKDLFIPGGTHGPEIQSSVIKKDEKLITQAGHRNVTFQEDFPTLRNEVKTIYPEPVFAFFGFKPLPIIQR